MLVGEVKCDSVLRGECGMFVLRLISIFSEKAHSMSRTKNMNVLCMQMYAYSFHLSLHRNFCEKKAIVNFT